jgi:hypothetical protein
MAVRHSDANWTQALADLREAPAKQHEVRSLRQAIEDAIDDVISCRQRGHTDSDIVAIFARNGIAMSLHTFRQYVRQARRAKEEQALGGKRKVARATKAQTRDTQADMASAAGGASSAMNAIAAVAPAEDSLDTPALPPTISPANVNAGAISQMASKPLRQTGKTAAEVLGHRFNEDV